MSFSIRKTIRRLWSPQHRLACDVWLWRRLVRGLRHRSDGRRESGAFLLGHIDGEVRTITNFVMYDDLDPHALDSGYVHIDGCHMGLLWALCREQGVSVVADIHTHPRGYGQSDTDRQNPMVAVRGHIGIIVPEFAARTVSRQNLGIYVYHGAHRWEEVGERRNRKFLYIGL
ncbi:TPA: Mov34/MPN/PAD-1 family protein [Burkholderia cepacia]|nr:Mov34/MPN/PAD-1 family protein [Burkholderia cepacia]